MRIESRFARDAGRSFTWIVRATVRAIIGAWTTDWGAGACALAAAANSNVRAADAFAWLFAFPAVADGRGGGAGAASVNNPCTRLSLAGASGEALRANASSDP